VLKKFKGGYTHTLRYLFPDLRFDNSAFQRCTYEKREDPKVKTPNKKISAKSKFSDTGSPRLHSNLNLEFGATERRTTVTFDFLNRNISVAKKGKFLEAFGKSWVLLKLGCWIVRYLDSSA
jgi:hypothetical protein